MKKGWIIAIAIVAVLVIWFATGYNSLVKQEEGVKTAWSQVENQYQRRSDLIPNLVNTVKGYAPHESETLEGVVAARARATQTTIDADNLTPEAIEKYQAAQGELTDTLDRFRARVAAFDELFGKRIQVKARTGSDLRHCAVQRVRRQRALHQTVDRGDEDGSLSGGKTTQRADALLLPAV